jgi:hypothetical protein
LFAILVSTIDIKKLVNIFFSYLIFDFLRVMYVNKKIWFEKYNTFSKQQVLHRFQHMETRRNEKNRFFSLFDLLKNLIYQNLENKIIDI